MDILSKEARSKNMAKIRSKNTSIELLVRKFLSVKGFRYRTGYSVAGTPDVAFPKNKVAIFINGCFWHMHGCKDSSIPKSNLVFWKNKLLLNKERDEKTYSLLNKEGWKTDTIWECELEKRFEERMDKVVEFLITNKCLNTKIVMPASIA